jgi:hypothetical protein
MSQFLRIGRNLRVNLNNILGIKHFPDKNMFKLLTTVNVGSGSTILGSGFYETLPFVYEISESDNSEAYDSIKIFFEKDMRE